MKHFSWLGLIFLPFHIVEHKWKKWFAVSTLERAVKKATERMSKTGAQLLRQYWTLDDPDGTTGTVYIEGSSKTLERTANALMRVGFNISNISCGDYLKSLEVEAAVDDALREERHSRRIKR